MTQKNAVILFQTFSFGMWSLYVIFKIFLSKASIRLGGIVSSKNPRFTGVPKIERTSECISLIFNAREIFLVCHLEFKFFRLYFLILTFGALCKSFYSGFFLSSFLSFNYIIACKLLESDGNS